MRYFLIMIAAMQFAAPAYSQTTIYRGKDGRMVGTAQKMGDVTIYRDSNGKVRGTAIPYGGGLTIYNDANGRSLGTATQIGR